MGLTGQQNRLAGTAGSLDSAVPAVAQKVQRAQQAVIYSVGLK